MPLSPPLGPRRGPSSLRRLANFLRVESGRGGGRRRRGGGHPTRRRSRRRSTATKRAEIGAPLLGAVAGSLPVLVQWLVRHRAAPSDWRGVSAGRDLGGPLPVAHHRLRGGDRSPLSGHSGESRRNSYLANQMWRTLNRALLVFWGEGRGGKR